MAEQPVIFCPRCGIGRCQPRRMALVRMVGGHILSAPDTPAYVCDICSYSEFDRRVLERLEQLLRLMRRSQRAEAPAAKTQPADWPNADNTGGVNS